MSPKFSRQNGVFCAGFWGVMTHSSKDGWHDVINRRIVIQSNGSARILTPRAEFSPLERSSRPQDRAPADYAIDQSLSPSPQLLSICCRAIFLFPRLHPTSFTFTHFSLSFCAPLPDISFRLPSWVLFPMPALSFIEFLALIYSLNLIFNKFLCFPPQYLHFLHSLLP